MQFFILLLLTGFPRSSLFQHCWLALGWHGAPSQMVITLRKQTAEVPDPADSSEQVHAFVGRLYLFDATFFEPIRGDGSLLVEMFDESKGTAVKREQWEIHRQQLPQLLENDIIGWGYKLSLPSHVYKPGMTNLRFRVYYKPAKGAELRAESKLPK